MRLFLLSLSMLALAVACGSSPDPKPADDTASDPRPGMDGCSACVIEACYMPDTPNRLARVELNFTPTADGKPVAHMWHGATLELKPKTGTSQAMKLKTDGWKKSGPVVAAIKDPGLKPAPGGWKDVSAVLTVEVKKDGNIEKKQFSEGFTVNVSACK